MTPAEFEERAYEAPLYNQLEGEDRRLFTPGQVLENRLGFDRGLFIAQKAIWKVLGRKASFKGAVLADYPWPGKNPPRREELPSYRLNLFLQAKRPSYYRRKPVSLRAKDSIAAPLWAFPVKRHQQRLLEALAEKTQGSSHVAYAAGAFHTYSALFAHTLEGTIVKNSTFPSVAVLAGHDCWYYQKPGSEGVANPNPEDIREQPLLVRVVEAARRSSINESNNLEWLEPLAVATIESARFSEVGGQFFDDLRALELLSPTKYPLQPTLKAYVQVQLFTIRFELSWLVLEGRD